MQSQHSAAGADLGALLARHEASALGYAVWVCVGATAVGLAGLAFWAVPLGLAASCFVAGWALAGALMIVYALRMRRGARVDLHERGFAYSAGGRRRAVAAGGFTITSAISRNGLPPTLMLAVDDARLAIRTHWFRAPHLLAEAIARLECPQLVEAEHPLGELHKGDPGAVAARTGPADAAAVREGLAKRGFRLKQRLQLGLIGTPCLLVWAWTDYRNLRLFESGLAEGARVWKPVAQLYQLGGLELALLPQLALALLCAIGTAHTWRRYRALRDHVGSSAIQSVEARAGSRVVTRRFGEGWSPALRLFVLLVVGLLFWSVLVGTLLLLKAHGG